MKKQTVNEIAEDLGVSPVYVEDETEFLEQYGFPRREKDKYIANFIIEEMSTELFNLRNTLYKQAAELFANDVYEKLPRRRFQPQPRQFFVCFVNRRRGILGGWSLSFARRYSIIFK